MSKAKKIWLKHQNLQARNSKLSLSPTPKKLFAKLYLLVIFKRSIKKNTYNVIHSILQLKRTLFKVNTFVTCLMIACFCITDLRTYAYTTLVRHVLALSSILVIVSQRAHLPLARDKEGRGERIAKRRENYKQDPSPFCLNLLINLNQP